MSAQAEEKSPWSIMTRPPRFVPPVATLLFVVLQSTNRIVAAFARWGPPPPLPLPPRLPLPTLTVVGPLSASPVTSRHTSEPSASSLSTTECLKTVDVLSLDSIRSSLIRQEETIIFALIERAQFRQNSIVYRKGGFGALGIPPGSVDPNDNDEDGDGKVGGEATTELSFLEYMLVGTETLHCGARRYLSPEEHAFFPERIPKEPMQALPSIQYSPELLSTIGGASDFNFNKRLLRKYLDVIVPSVCKPGDDEQHGSTTLCDIAVLQALSRRVHYGKFVAESKYRSDPDAYQRLVEAGDTNGVMALLTNEVVEHKVLRRARLKAATYGSEPILANLPPIEGSDATSTWVAAAAAAAVVAALGALQATATGHASSSSSSSSSSSLLLSDKGKVDPSVIETVYRDIVIPMTKDIEVAYLFLRCGRQPPPEYRE